MITGMEIAACQHMAVPAEVMQHVVNVESGYNPFAIGVVGGQLVRQPQNLGEAIATVHMLDSKGYNYSLGLAQVNRANLGKYGLMSYEQAFDVCPNLSVGARILSQCYASSGNDWGKSFSCYYSGNFITGYRDGYVQKIFDSINGGARATADDTAAIPLQLTTGPSPSALHGNVTGVTPVIAADSASYRLAIRSTALDTAAAAATRSIASALMSPTMAATAPQSPPAVEPANMVTSATSNAMQPVTPPLENNDVFVPQVRSIGEPPPAAAPSTSNGAKPQIVAATPSQIATADQADLRQGSQDNAFVF